MNDAAEWRAMCGDRVLVEQWSGTVVAQWQVYSWVLIDGLNVPKTYGTTTLTPLVPPLSDEGSVVSGNSVTVPEMIGPTMKRRLQTAGQRAIDAVEARNVAIEEAHAAGATLREIGDAVGLTHVAVMKIINRRK